MPRPPAKNIRLQIGVSAIDAEALRYVTETLGLDVSNTFRFLVREKQRELLREAAAMGQQPGGTKRKAS